MAIIGIDLGTSNSAGAVLRGGRPVIIPSAEGISLGGKAFPSYVAVTEQGEMLVGEPARRQAVSNPEGTASAFKRKMGTREKIKLHDKEFSPEQLSAFLLKKIKEDAEAYLGEAVEKAVVTVPAYFDDNQRNATKDACKIAGLEVARLVNEPTAASLAYGLDRKGEDKQIAVIDFGGGTLDVTIMDFGKGVFEVKSTSGDTQLGGTDMNLLLFDFLAEEVKKQSGIDIHKKKKASARLLEAAEMAKIELSNRTSTHISLPFLIAKEGELIDFDFDLNRSQLERIVAPVLEKCRGPVEQALKDAGLGAKDVDHIIFVGGPTRAPAVRNFFENLLDREGERGVDPMECVASGAAIQAGILSGEVSDIVLVDVTPLTLGVETLGGVATPLIQRNSPIPFKHTEIFTTAADMQTAVTINVFQGERPFASDNVSLGTFNLEGLAPAPRGVPKIDVTFDIDANGILNVTAKDTATGKEQSIRITGSTRLSDTEKKRMMDEAEKYEAEDKQRKEEIQHLNDADSLCYQTEKTIADFGEKLPEDLKKELNEALKATKDAVAEKDAKKAKEKMEVLKAALQKVGTAVYTQSAQQAPPPPPRADGNAKQQSTTNKSGTEAKAKVVDADYEEVT